MEGKPRIALLWEVDSISLGVCLGGRFDGWLMRKHTDGYWVSVRKLDIVEPDADYPIMKLNEAVAVERHGQGIDVGTHRVVDKLPPKAQS